MIENFKKLLFKIDDASDDDFSGTGIVVYREIDDIPIFPLHHSNLAGWSCDIESTLIEISKISNPYHDGFHFVSSGFQLTHTSQYFSPPIVKNVILDRSKIVGGRYMAALFGSYLSNVLLAGIITKKNGIVVFENGVDIFTRCRR